MTPQALTNDSLWVYFLYRMDFEFDPAKSKSNREKHGIDFIAAQQLWEDEDRLEIPARTEDEPRYVLIAALKQSSGRPFSPIGRDAFG